MKTIELKGLFLFACLFMSLVTIAQNTTHDFNTKKSPAMKTYVIEREITDAGKLTADQLKSISQTSCSVIKKIGPKIKWMHSYVTGNKIYCIYEAENEEVIREHAKKGGFPANKISQVTTVINPTTAE